MDSEETLLKWTDERAPLARAAPGVTLVDISETRSPVRQLMLPSVLGESSFGCLQEPIIGVEGLEYAIQATASVWMPFEQTYNGVSGDVDFDPLEWRLGTPAGCTAIDANCAVGCDVPTSNSTWTLPKNDNEYGK